MAANHQLANRRDRHNLTGAVHCRHRTNAFGDSALWPRFGAFGRPPARQLMPGLPPCFYMVIEYWCTASSTVSLVVQKYQTTRRLVWDEQAEWLIVWRQSSMLFTGQPQVGW